MNFNITTTNNAADWHATQALKAYRKKQWKDYRRHIRKSDSLRLLVAHMEAS